MDGPKRTKAFARNLRREMSPPEVIHLSRLTQLPVAAIIERLMAAGLDSIPGGGAEILVDRVRRLISKGKCGSRIADCGMGKDAQFALLTTC